MEAVWNLQKQGKGVGKNKQTKLFCPALSVGMGDGSRLSWCLEISEFSSSVPAACSLGLSVV